MVGWGRGGMISFSFVPGGSLLNTWPLIWVFWSWLAREETTRREPYLVVLTEQASIGIFSIPSLRQIGPLQPIGAKHSFRVLRACYCSDRGVIITPTPAFGLFVFTLRHVEEAAEAAGGADEAGAAGVATEESHATSAFNEHLKFPVRPPTQGFFSGPSLEPSEREQLCE